MPNLMQTLFDEILLLMMKFDQRKNLRDVDTLKPILLVEEYQRIQQINPTASQETASQILGTSTEEGWQRYSSVREDFYQTIENKTEIFEDKPYQLGGLDLEIDVLMALLFALKEPRVLEIGVANGYSSAFLYYALHHVGGSIVSIDMPRFRDRWGRKARARARLTKRGRIRNTRTLGDLNPGGVIPEGKYGSWLVPMDLRLSVRNTTFAGNALNILPELPHGYFEVCVFDAMKPYELRMRCFELVDDRLKSEGICFVDGYWVNDAFKDFCDQKQYPFWTFGRVGAFKKTFRG